MKMNNLLGKIWTKTRLHCLKKVNKSEDYNTFESIIRECDVDLYDQYTNDETQSMNNVHKEYYRIKLINQHAFQARFTESAIRRIGRDNIDKTLVLVDIGDSAGSHIKYLKKLLSDDYPDIHAVSVNLDPVAIEKIRKGGGEAVLCRAEEYKPEGLSVDVYLSYEMLEHLHNPSIFFYRMAKSDSGKYMVVTVPYRETSRVALHNTMKSLSQFISAEEEHIFELCPEDWKKLAWHSGWRTIGEEIYYQYPRNSVFRSLYKRAWELCDFEGFYAMFLERDMSAAIRYKDWEN